MEDRKVGRLIIISAPSGAGKTTMVDRLLAKHRDLKRSISYTTRKPRPGEVQQHHYHFVTKADFLEKRKRGFFLEWANVFGNYYGTSKKACFDWVQKGFDVVLTIDVQGMKKILQKFEKKLPIVTLFVMPPSMGVLKKRLKLCYISCHIIMNYTT